MAQEITSVAARHILNYLMVSAGVTTPTRPTGWTMGIGTSITNEALGQPSGSGYARQVVIFASAASPGYTENNVVVSFGPCSISAWGVVSCADIQDHLNNVLWIGVLDTPRTIAIGDSLVFSVSTVHLSVT